MFASDSQVTALVELFHGGTRLSYQRGEYIIRPGETPTSVYYIESGIVKAFNISKYGEENLLIIRKDHEFFPLIQAVTGQERDIIYQALSPTVVWRIDHLLFLDHLHNHPEVLPPVLDIVIEMYRIHSERILNLEYRSVRERLVSFLLTMSQRFGKQTKTGIVIDVPLRHQDIGSSINASRETTGRELLYLEKKGLLSNSQSTITLLNIDELKSML